MKLTNQDIKNEVEKNPIFLKIQELLIKDYKKGIDISNFDLKEYYEKAEIELLTSVTKIQLDKELKDLFCQKVYFKIRGDKNEQK